MTEKLDKFAPNPEMMKQIKLQLLRAGIPEEDIPMDWVAASAAAFLKYLVTTEQGQRFFAKVFNIHIREADNTKEYILLDNVNRKSFMLKNTQVGFFEGWLVDGVPIPSAEIMSENFIPPYALEVSDLERIKCDCCGIVSHCSKEVLDPVTDTLLQMCNFCLKYHEHPRVRDQQGHAKCEDCGLLHCCHHPERKRVKS